MPVAGEDEDESAVAQGGPRGQPRGGDGSARPSLTRGPVARASGRCTHHMSLAL